MWSKKFTNNDKTCKTIYFKFHYSQLIIAEQFYWFGQALTSVANLELKFKHEFTKGLASQSTKFSPPKNIAIKIVIYC